MQILAELIPAFRLYGVCIPCERMELLDLGALVQSLGRGATVSEVRMRLRCTQCGVRRPDLRVVYVGADAEASSFSYRRDGVL